MNPITLVLLALGLLLIFAGWQNKNPLDIVKNVVGPEPKKGK